MVFLKAIKEVLRLYLYAPQFHFKFLKRIMNGEALSLKTYQRYSDAYKRVKKARHIFPTKTELEDNFLIIKQILEKAEIRNADYPLLYTFIEIIKKDKIVDIMDLGGAYGLLYFQLLKSVHPGRIQRYVVCELNHIAEFCQSRITKLDQNNKLSFIGNIKELVDYDILVCNGSFQFVGNSVLDIIIKNDSNKPKYLILNSADITYDNTFFKYSSKLNTVWSFYNRESLIDSFKRSNYVLLDEWVSKKGREKKAISHFPFSRCGFFFERKE